MNSNAFSLLMNVLKKNYELNRAHFPKRYIFEEEKRTESVPRTPRGECVNVVEAKALGDQKVKPSRLSCHTAPS